MTTTNRQTRAVIINFSKFPPNTHTLRLAQESAEQRRRDGVCPSAGQPRLQTSALLQSPREETTGSRPEERLEEELSMTAGESGPAGGLTQSTSFKSRVSARRSPTPRSKRSVITRLPAAEGFLSAAPHCPCGETERETAKPVSLRGSTQVQFSSYRPTVALRAAAMRVFASRMQCEVKPRGWRECFTKSSANADSPEAAETRPPPLKLEMCRLEQQK